MAARTPGTAGAAEPRAALRASAVEGHGVEVARSFVGGGDGEQLAVGRNGRMRLRTGVRREPGGGTARGIDAPEIAFRHEDDHVAVDRGLAVVPEPFSRVSGGEHGQREQEQSGGGERTAHG